MIDSLPMLLVALLGVHYLADYPLQGDFLAKAKNPFAPIPGIPWIEAMSAHAAIHGMFVAFLTGIWWLFLAEFVVHFWTDYAKCAGKLTYRQDQAIHQYTKVLWVVIWGIV